MQHLGKVWAEGGPVTCSMIQQGFWVKYSDPLKRGWRFLVVLAWCCLVSVGTVWVGGPGLLLIFRVPDTQSHHINSPHWIYNKRATGNLSSNHDQTITAAPLRRLRCFVKRIQNRLLFQIIILSAPLSLFLVLFGIPFLLMLVAIFSSPVFNPHSKTHYQSKVEGGEVRGKQYYCVCGWIPGWMACAQLEKWSYFKQWYESERYH